MKLYSFDFDDTVVVTNSRIWTTEGPKTTAELASLSSHVKLDANPFREFGADTIDTCTIAPGPYLHRLAEALNEKSPIAIISARSLTAVNFRRLLERATLELLNKPLHDKMHFYSCNSPDWDLPGSDDAAFSRKCAAVVHFTTLYPEATSIGFSDDDPKNLIAMRGLFAGLQVMRPDLRYHIYDARRL